VLFTTCALLVQDLLAAKRDLTLKALLKRLGQSEALVIDDLVQNQAAICVKSASCGQP
jgi:DNA replication protein DnaC